jgi:hypothetical protein
MVLDKKGLHLLNTLVKDDFILSIEKHFNNWGLNSVYGYKHKPMLTSKEKEIIKKFKKQIKEKNKC